MDVSEIDRIEERERHNELIDMLDNVDFSDVMDDQTPSLVSLDRLGSPQHQQQPQQQLLQQGSNQAQRPSISSYATSEYAAKLMDFAENSAGVGELRGVLSELHVTSARNRALEMQLEHLKLQYEGIQAENTQLHTRCEDATASREAAEEQLILVQATLQQISAFEASAGMRINTSLEALRGQMLHAAREEIADLKVDLHTMQMDLDEKTKGFEELLQRHETETRGLRAEMQKLSNDLAQRTVLYASKEREWRMQLSQTERAQLDQNAQLIAYEGRNQELQKQLERLDGQRAHESIKCQELATARSHLDEELAVVRESEQQLAEENAEIRAQLVGLQNELEHLRRGGVDDLQRNMVHEVEQLRVNHEREMNQLQSELDRTVQAYKTEHERSLQYEQQSVKYKEQAEQNERALADIINSAASSDAVVAQLLERSSRMGSSSHHQHQQSMNTTAVMIDTQNSSTQTNVDYERVIRDLEEEVERLQQRITTLQRQLQDNQNTDLRMEAHQIQLEVKYKTAMQAELSRLRGELEEDYLSRKEELDKTRQSTLTESTILHEEIRQLREENRAIRADYEDIRQQQQDVSQIADMIATQRIDEVKQSHAAALDKLYRQWQQTLQDFTAYVVQPTTTWNSSALRETLAAITHTSTLSQAYKLVEGLDRLRDELARRSNPAPDNTVAAHCTAKVRVDLLRVMEPIMQMMLSHLSSGEEKLLRKVSHLDFKLQRCFRNVARFKSKSVQLNKEEDRLRACGQVEYIVKACQERLQQKMQAIGWRMDRNQKKVQQLQSTLSTARAMIMARQNISEAARRTWASKQKQLQHTIEQLEHELQSQGGFTEADSLDFGGFRLSNTRPDVHIAHVVKQLYAQVKELRSNLQDVSTTAETGLRTLFEQSSNQLRMLAFKHQNALSQERTSGWHQQVSPNRSAQSARHARGESAPSQMQMHEIVEKEHKRLSQEFEEKQASIISHWREEMRLAVAKIKAQAEADAQREYATKSEQARISHRAEMERVLSEKEQEFTKRLAKLNADWQVRFDDLDAQNAGAAELRVQLQQQLATERARMHESKQREMERLRHDIKAEMKSRYKAKVSLLKQRFESERDAILEMVRQECETLLREAKFAVARKKQRAAPEDTPQFYPEMLSPAQTQALLDSIVRRSNQNFEKSGHHPDYVESSDRTPYSQTVPVVTPSTTSTLGSSNRRRPRTAGNTRVR